MRKYILGAMVVLNNETIYVALNIQNNQWPKAQLVLFVGCNPSICDTFADQQIRLKLGLGAPRPVMEQNQNTGRAPLNGPC